MAREKVKEERVEGKHTFEGSCAPADGNPWGMSPGQETFSVGVFAWVKTANGKGLKRGPVKVRVYGRVGNAHLVHAAAKGVCDLLDIGAYGGPKRLHVRWDGGVR